MTSLVVSNSNSNNNGLRLVALATLLALFVLVAITYSTHAVDRHGIAEVNQIRSCIQKNGPIQTWRSRTDPNTFYHICLLEDGRYGLQVVVDRITEVLEKTAFIKGDGSWNTVTNYLSKFASRYNGIISH